MKCTLVFLLMIGGNLWANPLAFKIQFLDRSVKVSSPDKASNQFAVVVENKSLSDLHAKFSANGKDLIFISVKSSEFKTVEFRAASGEKVQFIPLNPPAQEVLLEFGKKIYEIPTKK